MINKNQHELDYCSYVCSNDKPLELYLFIDPFCPDSFALEPVIR